MRFSVLAEFFCGFAVLDDFLFGFAVSNTPQCPPQEDSSLTLLLWREMSAQSCASARNMARDTFPGLSLALVRKALPSRTERRPTNRLSKKQKPYLLDKYVSGKRLGTSLTQR